MPRLRTVSWIMLAVVGAFILANSTTVMLGAYRRDFSIGSTSVGVIASGRPGVENALRGGRGTLADYAAGYAALLLSVAAGPYRKGDTSSWWAILVSAAVFFVFAVARQTFLGTTLGMGAPRAALGFIVLALILDAGRLKGA
jgi:hypothetical protein